MIENLFLVAEKMPSIVAEKYVFNLRSNGTDSMPIFTRFELSLSY